MGNFFVALKIAWHLFSDLLVVCVWCLFGVRGWVVSLWDSQSLGRRFEAYFLFSFLYFIELLFVVFSQVFTKRSLASVYKVITKKNSRKKATIMNWTEQFFERIIFNLRDSGAFKRKQNVFFFSLNNFILRL